MSFLAATLGLPLIPLLLLLLLLAFPTPSSSQFNPATANVSPPRLDDVPHIRCAVCRIAAGQILQRVAAVRARAAGTLDDEALLRIADCACDPETGSGAWVNRVELVATADGGDGEGGAAFRLEPVLRDDEAECKVACRTVKRACDDVKDGRESDLADLLYHQETTVEKVEGMLCAKECSKEQPPLPPGGPPREEFVKKEGYQLQMEQSMRELKETSPDSIPPMTMYDRNDIENLGDGYDDEDEDDDPEEQEFSVPAPSFGEKETLLSRIETLTRSAQHKARELADRVVSTTSTMYRRLSSGQEEL